MRTDELVSLLAAGVSPVPAHTAARRLAIALGWGVLGAAMLMIAGLEPRTDLLQVAVLPMFWIKLAFPAAFAVAACVAVQRLSRPGVRVGAAWAALVLPIAALWSMAAAVLLNAAPEARLPLVLGSTWRTCSLSIAMLSLPVLAAVFWALKGLAPTRLALSGALAGWLAGSVGALVYALHCTEMQAPFLGAWYVLGMAMPTFAGALLGPRLLRW